ncbi:MAG: twin-arginine translocation signal domain-containing protein, partial [Acidobacteriota bacterium]
MASNEHEEQQTALTRGLSRRDFLVRLGAAGATGTLALWSLECGPLGPGLEAVQNPLDYYPARDWEKIYRDQYRFDRTFT